MSNHTLKDAYLPEPCNGAQAARPRGRIYTFYRRCTTHPGVPIFLLVLLVAGLALALIYTASRGQDQVAMNRSVALVDAVLNSQIRDVGEEVFDYAYWDDAVARLTGTIDRRWADQNIGGYAYDYLGVSISFVIASDGEPTLSFVAGQEHPPNDLLSRAGGGLDQLVTAARLADPGNPTFEAGLIEFDGAPHIAAAAPITPETETLSADAARQRHVLVFLRAIDESLLDGIAGDFSIDRLRLAGPNEAAEPPAKGLRSVDGHYLGLLRWDIELPGRHLIRKAVLPIVVAFGAVAILALTIFRTMVATSRELKTSLDLLARRNEELQASEHSVSTAKARLQSALDYSPEAIAFFDVDEHLIICNERFRRLMHPGFRHLVAPGESLNTFSERYASAWFGSAEAGGGAEWLARFREIHDQQGLTAEIGMACGRWMLVRERRTSDGGFVMLFTDITELHGRQKSLTDHSSRLQVTLDTLREGVAVFDSDQRLVLCNRRFGSVLNLPVAALRAGAMFDEIVPWFVSSKRLDIESDAHPGRSAPPRGAEDLPESAEYETPEGLIVKVRVAQAPEGAVVITFRDVTERRKAEHDLREAMEQADLANRSKTEFLANVSHELRTPLNAIIGFSEIMMNQMFGPIGSKNYLDYAGDIRESGRHLLTLINDILDLAKVEAGHIDLNEEIINIGDVGLSALRIVRERAQAAGLTIGVELPHDLPSVFADQRAIKQILINLLSNAIKFTRQGGVVALRGGLDRDGNLQLAVVDTGIGIARKDIPTALTPFGQVEGSLSRSAQGTGLGLPLSVSLAEQHGGSIEIHSVIGEGTEVVVTLPAERIVRRAETA